MFDLFSKNNPGRVLVKYADDIGYLYKNLKKLEDFKYDEARNNLNHLLFYYKNEISKNPNMDKLNLTFKCMIPEMYAFKRVTVAYSLTEITALLYQKAEKYELVNEFNEIYNV
jgi:hypothetical protein